MDFEFEYEELNNCYKNLYNCEITSIDKNLDILIKMNEKIKH